MVYVNEKYLKNSSIIILKSWWRLKLPTEISANVHINKCLQYLWLLTFFLSVNLIKFIYKYETDENENLSHYGQICMGWCLLLLKICRDFYKTLCILDTRSEIKVNTRLRLISELLICFVIAAYLLHRIEIMTLWSIIFIYKFVIIWIF